MSRRGRKKQSQGLCVVGRGEMDGNDYAECCSLLHLSVWKQPHVSAGRETDLAIGPAAGEIKSAFLDKLPQAAFIAPAAVSFVCFATSRHFAFD